MDFIRVNPRSKFKDVLRECIKIQKLPVFVPLNINQTIDQILQDETFNMDFAYFDYIFNKDILKIPVQDYKAFVYSEIFRFKTFEGFIQMYSKINLGLSCSRSYNLSGYYDNHQFILIVSCLTNEIITTNNMIKQPHQFRKKIKDDRVFCLQMPVEIFFNCFNDNDVALCTSCCFNKKRQHFFVKYNAVWGKIKIKSSWNIFFTKDHILFQEDV